MQTVFLILLANFAAFALGVVTTLWLANAPPVTPPPPVDPPAANATALVPLPAAAQAQVDEPPPGASSPAPATSPARSGPPAGPAAQISPAAAATSPALDVAPPTTTPARGGYSIQLGAFQEAASAARMQADLKRYGYTATIGLGLSGQKTWHLVQVGGFADRSTAAEAAAAIQKRTGAAGLVIKTPSS